MVGINGTAGTRGSEVQFGACFTTDVAPWQSSTLLLHRSLCPFLTQVYLLAGELSFGSCCGSIPALGKHGKCIFPMDPDAYDVAAVETMGLTDALLWGLAVANWEERGGSGGFPQGIKTLPYLF